jgi:hypothetical protein
MAEQSTSIWEAVMSMPTGSDLSAGPPAPPPKPNGYVDNWLTHIQHVGGATLSGGVSTTSCVYDTSFIYHFTLQPEWRDSKQRRITQPHITIKIGNTEYHVYINAHNTTQARLDGNADARIQFVAQGIADPDGLLQNFCNSLVAKRQAWSACRDYDTALAEYRKMYPWSTVVKGWTAQQNAAHASLVVRSKSGGVFVVVPQTGTAPPCVLKMADLRGDIQEPNTPPADAFSWLSDRYCVVCLDDGDRYVTVTKVNANRREDRFGKDSPERQMLQKMQWADAIQLKADAEIAAFFDASTVPGSLNGNELVFWFGNSFLQVDVTAEGLLKRDGFTRKVNEHIDDEIRLWAPRTQPGEAEFQERATAAVDTVGKNSSVVDDGTGPLVIPRKAAKKRRPTDEERRIGLPQYEVVGKYTLRGKETSEAVLKLGTEYCHMSQNQLTKLGEGEDRSNGMVLITLGGKQQGPFKIPDKLSELDFDRYTWINGLKDAGMVPCGQVRLITLSEDEYIVVLDDDAQFGPGGAYFAVTGTPGCLCFTHPVTQKLAVVDPAKAPTAKVVHPRFTLGRGRGFVLENTAEQFVVCPAALPQPPTPVTAGVVVIADKGGALLGFADLNTLGMLDMQTLIAAGHLTGQVNVSLDGTQTRFVSMDLNTCTATLHEFKSYVQAPLLSSDDETTTLLEAVIKSSESFTAGTGTGEFAGLMILRPVRTVELYSAVVVTTLSSGMCIISYDPTDHTWENSASVQLVQAYGATCNVLVTNADGTLAGYASSLEEETATEAFMALVSEYPGSHRRVKAYPVSSTGEPEESATDFDLIVPDGTVDTEPFTAPIVLMQPSLLECVDLLTEGFLYATVSTDSGAWTLCTPSVNPAEAFIVPGNMTFADALVRYKRDTDSGYVADDEADDLT